MDMRNTAEEVYGYQGPIHSMYACGLMLKCIYILMYWKTEIPHCVLSTLWMKFTLCQL